MAHTRTTDQEARIIDQCARGRYIRNVNSVDYIIAAARTDNTAPNNIVADVIPGEIRQKGMLIAPSDGKIECIMVNGSPYATLASGGVYMLQTYKQGKALVTGSGLRIGGTAVSGFVTALNSGVTYDLTLNTASGYETTFTAGQAIYSTVTANSGVVQSGPGLITVSVEWIPYDASYASS